MGIITKEALEVVEQAKRRFENDEKLSTYTNEKLGYIALRWGLMDRAIKIYKLDSEVGIFEDWIETK